MNSSNSEEVDLDKSIRYQKLNFFVSILLILLTLLISLLNNAPVIIFLSLPAMFVLTYCEEKLNFTLKIYSRYIYLINCLGVLALLVFWIFPAYLGITLINIQFIIFCLSLYFIFQIFMKLGYFKEKNVLVLQNILAVTCFTIILYSFFPLVEFVYITFTLDPILILISKVLIHSIIVLIITLISFYFLYARVHLYEKPWKLFNTCVITVFLLIELIWFTLINFKNIVLGVPGLIQRDLIISTIFLSIAFLSFILFNYIIKVFSRETSLSYSYFTFWFLSSSIFIVLIALYWNNYVIILFDSIFFTILSLINLKFGTVINKIEETTFFKIAKIYFYALLLEIFLLFCGIFNLLLLDMIITIFLSFCIIGVILNLLSSYEKLVSRKMKLVLTSFIFAFDIFVVGFYFTEANIDYFYFYLVAPIVFCLLLYAPIYYLYKEDVIKPKVLSLYSYTSSWVIAVLIFVLNFFIINIYFSTDIVLGTLLNVLFFTFCLVLLISFGKKIKRIKESSSKFLLNILSYPIIIEIFVLLFTVFTIYLRFDVFLSSFLSLSIISIIFYLLSKEERLLPKFPATILITITLYYGIIIAGYYVVIFTIGTFFIPLIIVCILSYLPIFYLYKKSVLNHKTFLSYHFYCSIIISLAIFIFNFFVIINFFNIFLIILILINILYITVVSYYIFKFGAKINLLSSESFKKFTNTINYFIILEIYAILFSNFNLVFLIEPILSAYFSTILICFLINILSKNRIIFTEKSAIGVNILALSFTSVLSSYYIYLIVYNSVFVLVIPLLVFSSLMLLPLFYTYSKKVFSKLVEKIILIDSLLISALIMALPSIIRLELIRFGMVIDYYFIIIPTIFLFFGFLRYLEFLFDKYKLKENYVVSLKSSQIVIWITISIVIALEAFNLIDSITNNFWLNLGCSCLTFFVVNLAILIPLENLKQRVFENKISKFDYYKIYKIYEYTKNISFFAIITSIAALTAIIIPSHSLASLLYLPESLLFMAITNLGIFMLAYLIFSVVSGYLFKIEFLKIKSIFEISAWIFIKLFIFLYIFILPIQISMLLRIVLPLLIIIFMSPITIYYLRRIFFISDESLRISKKLTFYLFSMALLIIFADFFWIFSTNIPFFSSNQALQIIIVLCATYLFFNYYLLKFDTIIERASQFRMIKIFSGSLLVLLSLFSILPSIFEYFTYIIFFVMLYLFISNRNRNYILRTIFYASLSWFMFVKVIGTLDFYMLIPTFSFSYFIFYFFIYCFSLILVFFLSIVFNMKKTNMIEKFVLYALISTTCLLLLIINTVIPLIYNISISLFLFLLLTGNFFYKQKDERYKWFIRPCVLLLIFGFMSYISHFILFNNLIFTHFKPILTFTLTSTITGIAYVGTYNKTPEKFRKITFYIAFSIYTISFPIFMYFFLNAILSLPLWDTFLFLITINIGIVLFYISIGVYYWKFSWAIWKAGWRLWIIVPFVNFYIINELFTNVSFIKNTLNFFNILSINGSFIISFVICIMLSLPFWYSWIKKHFTQILIIVWSFSLFFLYWFSQNVFPDNMLITNVVFFVFAISLLVPLLYRLRLWKIISVLWLFYTVVNVSFLFSLFLEIGFPLELIFSINLIIIGIFFIILSFFPNLKNIKNIILVGSYLTSLIGIFLTIFSIINAIILNFYISINLAFITLALSLFSSRLLKLNKTFINVLISSILVVNFSFFTYNTLIMIPEFKLFSVFLAITVFGGSLFIFNKFRMIIPIKKIFPLTILSLGVSLTLSYLTYIFLPGFIYLAIAVFIIVNSLFLRSVLYEYRFILWYVFPIPIILLSLQFMVLIDLFQSPFIIVLSFLILYTALFQIPCMVYKKNVKDQETLNDFGLLKVESILSLFLHFEIGLLSFSLVSEIVDFGFFEIALISLIIFFISTLLEIHLIKKVNEKIIYFFNLVAYILISIGIFMFLNQFIAIDASLFVLNLVVFLTLQFYTLYALSYYIEKLTQYEASKIRKIRNQIQSILLNSIFIVVSLYISLLLSNLLIIYNPLLSGYPSLSFFGMVFSLLLFILNGVLNRAIEIKNRNIILFCAFVFFQFFFAVFWIGFYTVFGIFDLFRILLVLISETVFTSYTIHLSGKITTSEKWKENIKKIYSFIILCIYLEVSLLFFGLFQLFLGYEAFIESLILSQIILFLISMIEIKFIKKINEKIIYFFNITAYILISIGLFMFLNKFITIDASIFVLNLVILLVLQFYTLYALSYYIEVLTQYEASKIRKVRNQIQSILLNSIFIVVSLYISLLLSSLLITYNPLLTGYPSLSFIGMIFSLLLFVLNGVLNRAIEIKNRNIILLCTFIFFQFFFAVFWIGFYTVFGIFDLFRIVLVLISETVFTSYTIYVSGKLTKSEKWKENIKKIYSFIILCIYLEVSLLFFGLFQLFLGYEAFYESLLFSQIILFLISIVEIYAIKRLKEGSMEIVHTLSFINISWILFIILFGMFSYSMYFLVLIAFLMILMQFYTNYSYFDLRRKFSPDNLTSFVKWKNFRQNILGWGVYILLLGSILNILVLMGQEFHIIFLTLSLTTHLLALFDRYVLKFLGKASNFVISFSWIILIGFSILFYLDWISIFFIQIIPIIIFLLIVQIAYLFRLLKDWEVIKSNQLKINVSLLKLVYLNLITWPLYYISLDFFISLNLVLISFIVLLGLTFLDELIEAIAEKVRKNLRVTSFILTEVLLSADIYLALELFVNPNLILNNLSLSLFFFMIVNLVLFKPFKRKKISSFLYSLVLFLLLSIITFNISSSGWSFSWIFIGFLLYLFVFMLEELKAFLNNIVDNLRLIFIRLKNVLLSAYYSFINFLKNNIKVIEIILCILVGITVGIVFSDIVLNLLRWDHATLLGLASSGILISFLPPKKTEDIDQIFKNRMQRFITLWISFTIFVFALILPYITDWDMASFIFATIMILLSIITLGAIIAIYIYRIEKKQKISIKWRFYTTIILIILTIIVILLSVILYLGELIS
ncbi:MAG: hypothetical protein ACTSPU_00615 [Promethearchaeota archaeon]